MSTFPDAVVLDIDLTHETIRKEIIPGSIYRQYPGGSALALYLILQNIEPHVDPLSPDNILVFAVSPLTGLPVAGLSRIVAASKSPLTGGIGDSQAGGDLPVELKANGIDALLFRGRAEKPVYLHIKEGKARLRPAEHIWGKTTGEAEDIIKDELEDDSVEIAQIGPGGENMVRFACIIHDCCRANGRTGNGAVMGSKNLKAVTVAKGPKPRPIDPEGFKKINEGLGEKLKDPFWQGFKANGTSANVEGFQGIGYLPSRNFISGQLDGAEQIFGRTMSQTVLTGNDNCYFCPVRCKRIVEIPGLVDPRYGGPEYETIGAVGSYCGITSLESVCMSNQLCNMYGLDTISCGATIAFAMECYEKGIWTPEKTGGMAFRFGDAETIHEIIRMIAYREGVGDILAEGSKKAAEIIGGGASRYALTAKGLEFPAHMPQLKPALGLIYAVNPFGADHQSSEHDSVLCAPADSKIQKWLGMIGLSKVYSSTFGMDEFKTFFALRSQFFYSTLDTLCMCQFIWGPSWQLFGPEDMLTLCRSGIGWDASIDEFIEIGERRVNMMRYFNAREGFTKEEDTLPERFFDEPLQGGPSDGVRVNRQELEKGKVLYYDLAGWDEETGNPTPEKMREISLEWVYCMK